MAHVGEVAALLDAFEAGPRDGVRGGRRTPGGEHRVPVPVEHEDGHADLVEPRSRVEAPHGREAGAEEPLGPVEELDADLLPDPRPAPPPRRQHDRGEHPRVGPAGHEGVERRREPERRGDGPPARAPPDEDESRHPLRPGEDRRQGHHRPEGVAEEHRLAVAVAPRVEGGEDLLREILHAGRGGEGVGQVHEEEVPVRGEGGEPGKGPPVEAEPRDGRDGGASRAGSGSGGPPPVGGGAAAGERTRQEDRGSGGGHSPSIPRREGGGGEEG